MSATLASSAWTVFETVLVLTIVGACALHAARVLWPDAWRRARIACALSLLRTHKGHWLRPLGRLLAPKPVITASTGSCGPCRGCDKDTIPTVIQNP